MIFEGFSSLENAALCAKSISHPERRRTMVCENRIELSECEGYLFDLAYPVVFVEWKKIPTNKNEDAKRAELSLKSIIGTANRYGGTLAAVIRGGAQ
jgi:hypothetical protein